jgi:hypothetical protein
VKLCEGLFSQLLETIQSLAAEAEADGQQSGYSTVSPESSCRMASLKFVDTEQMALGLRTRSLVPTPSRTVARLFCS